MAYDKKRKDEIDQMSVGELIHTMLVEFNPAFNKYENNDGVLEPGHDWQQSSAYMWAKDRLDQLLTGKLS